MMKEQEYSRKLIIENSLGFHVRPVQRFSELARAFKGNVQVEIEGDSADGKSVMGLMSLGAQSGSEMNLITSGIDAEQALELLSYVVSENFFVEEQDDPPGRPHHIDRLVNFSECFKSNIMVEVNGEKVEATDADTLEDIGLQPTTCVKFHVQGEDEEQAAEVIEKLADYCFYVEEAMGAKKTKEG